MDKKHFLSISELNAKYDREELASIPGDREFRYQVLSPLFENLYENKVVYYERFVCIVKLEDIIITPERFEATAIPYLLIKKAIRMGRSDIIPEMWRFGGVWEIITLSLTTMTFYSGVSIWCDPHTVEKVEKLVLDKKYEEALNLTLWEGR